MPVTKDERQMAFDLGTPDARREAVREVVLQAVATATYAQVAAATGLTRHAVAGMVMRARRSGIEVIARQPTASPATLAGNAAKALAKAAAAPVVRVVPPEPVVVRTRVAKPPRPTPSPRERAAFMLRRRGPTKTCRAGVDLWPAADERILVARVVGGDDLDAIARDLGRTREACRRRASALGAVRPAREAAWTPALDAEAIKLRAHGCDDAEVARRMGRSQPAVQTRLSRLRELGHAVAPSPRCRMWTDTQVDAVVVRARRGESNMVIAAAIGRSRVAVEEMVRGLREQGRLPGSKIVDESEPGAVRRQTPAQAARLAAVMAEMGRGYGGRH